ncbi:uncharacterized protein LOC127254774 isoform X2 [Andrographis paniculata]|uniref:uncharacterized protein LOC127254774 isoform X2 n=1 Tax=Andrographis paniculata TaxID=175694 RepID=UPI0021E8D4BA|nr:uncharacterized protein LOC127254774 isoform X2 [Andrographis paniculata]
MRRNCNLELRLLTPCVYSPSSIAEEKQQQQQQKTSSVFYNGRMDVFDATELQVMGGGAGSGDSVAGERQRRRREVRRAESGVQPDVGGVAEELP